MPNSKLTYSATYTTSELQLLIALNKEKTALMDGLLTLPVTFLRLTDHYRHHIRRHTLRDHRTFSERFEHHRNRVADFDTSS